jgi:hypothetical protein
MGFIVQLRGLDVRCDSIDELDQLLARRGAEGERARELADEIERMVFAFDAGDGRRAAVRELARKVRDLGGKPF